MKKRILFTLIFIALCLPMWGSVKGDLNGDGIVDVSDVNMMIDKVLGKADLNNNTADLDGNSVIDVSDVNLLIDIVLGKAEPWSPPGPSNATVFTVNGVSFKMVDIEGGTFIMGASEDDTDAFWQEKPLHEVTLSDFAIGATEVTQDLWVAVMGSNPSWFNEYGNSDYGSYHSRHNYGTNLHRPVEFVSWDDCQEFIMKLNELTGKTFRLPTEAEWEYAARGSKNNYGYKYAGSNTIGEVAWYYDNSFTFGTSSPDYGTHTVGTKAPNELGLYDMSGNVWEWCSDWYGSSYYSSSPRSNPAGPSSGSNRVIRGGSWNYIAGFCRVLCRFYNSPDISYSHLGLRLAL